MWQRLACDDEKARVGSLQSWSKEGTVRHCQSTEASILWSHHDETRESPGERDTAGTKASTQSSMQPPQHSAEIVLQVNSGIKEWPVSPP